MARAPLVLAVGMLVLVFAPQLRVAGATMMLTLLALLACLWYAVGAMPGAPRRPPGSLAQRSVPVQRRPRWPLLRMLLGLTVHRYRHAGAARLLLAALPQLAAGWMVLEVGKYHEAQDFFQVANALTAGITSGLFTFFYTEKQRLAPLLRSIAHAGRRLAVAELVVVLAVTAALLCVAPLLIGARLGWDSSALRVTAASALFWLACLPLFGAPLIQRHQDGVLLKCGLGAVLLLISFQL